MRLSDPSRPAATALGRAARAGAGTLVVCALLAQPGCNILDRKPKKAATTSVEPAVHLPPPVSDPVAHARKLEQQGDLEAARREFERAIAENPRLTVAYLGAGDIYRKQGDYAAAEQRYGKAAELEPRNFDAQYLHGLSLHMLNRLGEAVRAYLRALTARPDDFSANMNLATAYLQLQEPRQGLPYAERAVKVDPTSSPARANLGAIYAALDRHQDAITEYQQAAELAQLSAPLLINLADSLGKIGRYEEMVNTLQQLVATDPSASAYERLGSGLFRLRRYDQAEGAFRESMALDGAYYPAVNGIAVCLLNRWVWSSNSDEVARNEAIMLLRKSLVLEKRQPRIIELLGRYQ